MAEIELKTAPADFRFPTTNQSRHCFTRYVEYHRCVNAKGETAAADCEKFAKYYRSLCPGEWNHNDLARVKPILHCFERRQMHTIGIFLMSQVEKWNEQRENGTFAGPL